MRLLGAILAGGRSRRFGSDKAVAMLSGRTLIEHAIAALAPQVERIVVCGREMPGRISVADLPRPDLGPLGGLAGALAYGDEEGFDVVVTAPCDAPRLPGDLVPQLLAAAAPAYVEALPVIGLWPTALATPLRRHLEGDGPRSVRRWAQAVDAAAISLCELPPNVNHPEDFANLR